jgi:hypothetical protein
MKSILSILWVVLLLASVAGKVTAQPEAALDMALINPSILPAPASYPGTATIGFAILAEVFDQPLSSDDLGIYYASVSVQLNNLQGSSANMPTGPGADLFNWQYNAVQNIYIGSSKDVTMAADLPYQITLRDLPVVQATSSTTYTTGFVANLSPPYVLENNSTDDAVEIFTSSPLPVTLVSFSAAKEGNLAQLAWATTEETNSDRFDIQRSLDGKAWVNIGTVKSNGESTVLRRYGFVDKAPLNGVNLYRLKMVDKDETFAYSSLKGVRFDGLARNDSSFAYVYPNPSSDKVYLNSVDLSLVKMVSVVDMNGRAVVTARSAADGVDVKGLSAGGYLLKVSNTDGSSSTHKFLISK